MTEVLRATWLDECPLTKPFKLENTCPSVGKGRKMASLRRVHLEQQGSVRK